VPVGCVASRRVPEGWLAASKNALCWLVDVCNLKQLNKMHYGDWLMYVTSKLENSPGGGFWKRLKFSTRPCQWSWWSCDALCCCWRNRCVNLQAHKKTNKKHDNKKPNRNQSTVHYNCKEDEFCVCQRPHNSISN